MAAHEDNDEMVRFLLASGADKNLVTEGLTPLDVALQQGNDKVSKIFLSIILIYVHLAIFKILLLS